MPERVKHGFKNNEPLDRLEMFVCFSDFIGQSDKLTSTRQKFKHLFLAGKSCLMNF